MGAGSTGRRAVGERYPSAIGQLTVYSHTLGERKDIMLCGGDERSARPRYIGKRVLLLLLPGCRKQQQKKKQQKKHERGRGCGWCCMV